MTIITLVLSVPHLTVITRCEQFIARWNSVIVWCDCSFHAMCVIHCVMKLSYRVTSLQFSRDAWFSSRDETQLSRDVTSFHVMCAIHPTMKLSYIATWLQFSGDVCNSSRDSTQLSRHDYSYPALLWDGPYLNLNLASATSTTTN